MTNAEVKKQILEEYDIKFALSRSPSLKNALERLGINPSLTGEGGS